MNCTIDCLRNIIPEYKFVFPDRIMALSPQQLDAQTEATMKQVAIIIIIYYIYTNTQ